MAATPTTVHPFRRTRTNDPLCTVPACLRDVAFVVQRGARREPTCQGHVGDVTAAVVWGADKVSTN